MRLGDWNFSGKKGMFKLFVFVCSEGEGGKFHNDFAVLCDGFVCWFCGHFPAIVSVRAFRLRMWCTIALAKILKVRQGVGEDFHDR